TGAALEAATSGGPPAPGAVGGAQGAATFHVFPQLADGISGGTGYVSAVVATNTSSQSTNCTLKPSSTLANRFSNLTFTLPATAGLNTHLLQSVFATAPGLPLVNGYATLTCDQPVVAYALYLLDSATRAILSGATVFSSPPTTRAQFFVPA